MSNHPPFLHNKRRPSQKDYKRVRDRIEESYAREFEDFNGVGSTRIMKF